MGRAIPFSEDETLEEKVKCLADEELLEIWAESQQIEAMIAANFPNGAITPPNMEQAIINELLLRRNRKISQTDTRARRN